MTRDGLSFTLENSDNEEGSDHQSDRGEEQGFSESEDDAVYSEEEVEDDDEDDSFVVDQNEVLEDLNPESKISPFDPVDPANIVPGKRRRAAASSGDQKESSSKTIKSQEQ